MAMMPKRVKYRKSQRGRIRGFATSGNYVAFGDYGLQAMQPGWLSAQQIEAARVVISRFLGTEGRYWCRIFPHKSITAIAAETRMGKGKGEIEYWAAVVKPGTVLFEIAGMTEAAAREAFRLQSGKLPIRTKFVRRRAEF
ncbi:MAG: 50S ribosomal protein L16 [Planctomycetota bacterium]